MGHSFLIGGAGRPQSGRGLSGAERRIGPRESGAGARIEPRKETKRALLKGESREYTKCGNYSTRLSASRS